jgi:hypothetical protein
VKIQSFFERFYQRYFIVQDKSATTESQDDLAEEDEDDKAQILQEIKKTQKRDAEKQAVVEKKIEKNNNISW